MHRRAVAAIAALFALIGGLLPQASAAQPPNSGGEEIQSKSDIKRATERVRTIAEKAARAKDALTDAQLELAAAYDKVTAAQRKAHAAKAAAESAQHAADKAAKQAAAAVSRLRKARKEVDNLAAASLQLGNLDSARALLGADDVDDMLARASLLEAISASQADTLHDLRRVSTKKADKDAAAKAALQKSIAKHDAAQRAVEKAKHAYQEARSGEKAAQQRGEDLVEGGGTIHYGLDIANRIGTPVVSVMDGTVISSGPASGFERWVRVRHDNGIVTVYGHIHESLVSVGQRVSAGQQIATIGSRGQSTGPHLHFGVRRSGSKINPLTWLHAHGVAL